MRMCEISVVIKCVFYLKASSLHGTAHAGSPSDRIYAKSASSGSPFLTPPVRRRFATDIEIARPRRAEQPK